MRTYDSAGAEHRGEKLGGKLFGPRQSRDFHNFQPVELHQLVEDGGVVGVSTRSAGMVILKEGDEILVEDLDGQYHAAIVKEVHRENPSVKIVKFRF